MAKIGVNGMSLMKAFNEDIYGTAKRLREGGCEFIEPLSDWCADPKLLEFYENLTGIKSNWSPENTTKRIGILRECGIKVQGMFVFTDYIEEQAEELGAFCKQNGIDYVVISYHGYEGIEDVYRKVATVKHVSGVLKKFDVQLVIHNHEHDLALITDKNGETKPILDIFMEQCTTEELVLEADTGWLLYAGVEPAEFVQKYINRIRILHLKDICKEHKEIDRADIHVACGQGAVNFKAVFDVMPQDKKDTMIYVLDQDASKGDIVEDQIASIKYFESIGL